MRISFPLSGLKFHSTLSLSLYAFTFFRSPVSGFRFQVSNSLFPTCTPIENFLEQNLKVCNFHTMKATLTELRRETSKVMGPVIHACKKVVLTEHGREIASIIPIVSPDRKRAMQMLAAIGEVALPSRK